MRTQSTETKLRHAKARNALQMAIIASLKEELAARKQIGGMMSNLCFNLSQNEAYDATHRQSMRDCRTAWDAIRKVSA